MEAESTECPAVPMDSEDPLFMLHTSGSTGKAKGIVHATAGYLLYASVTFQVHMMIYVVACTQTHTYVCTCTHTHVCTYLHSQYVLDYRPGDISACVADLGWIAAHSYSLYSPLCIGGTSVLFESLPNYPNPGNFMSLYKGHCYVDTCTSYHTTCFI